jgi:hypothetical protein
VTRMFLPTGGYEASILWRFLDGVSAAVSMRMGSGSAPVEENLTFLLCELLDANTTSLHALSYPLSQAKTDLEASDAGVTVDVEFQTHEHSKHVESRYSGADLGIVFAVNHPVFGAVASRCPRTGEAPVRQGPEARIRAVLRLQQLRQATGGLLGDASETLWCVELCVLPLVQSSIYCIPGRRRESAEGLRRQRAQPIPVLASDASVSR